jgi:L,D-peptidoglycan transpeptidase YkuD (ErfK/YbiS/YcfS/YnhG family)
VKGNPHSSIPEARIPEARIIVRATGPEPWQGQLQFKGRRYPCAIGSQGLTMDKCEGDHKTPIGRFALRRLLYRPDIFPAPPETSLAAQAIAPDDGWCDDPLDPKYNRPVKRPYPASTEKMWRDDAVYDLVVPLGYNDINPVPGWGSAIFLHIARPDYSGTEGCIALSVEDMLEILPGINPATVLIVKPPKAG